LGLVCRVPAPRRPHPEAESGAGADALEKRPQLAEAIAAARKLRGPVLVAKLDRLSRDVHFISGLMAHGVEFVVTSLGAAANRRKALEQVAAVKLHVADALAGGRSLRRAAEWLNERGIESLGGGRWHAPSLLKAAVRLGLREKAPLTRRAAR